MAVKRKKTSKASAERKRFMAKALRNMSPRLAKKFAALLVDKAAPLKRKKARALAR